jgi:hypothetical protein
MSSSIQGTRVSVITDRLWSLSVFYQLFDSNLNRSIHLDGVWSHTQLAVRPVPLSPVASVTYSGGKQVSDPLPHTPWA